MSALKALWTVCGGVIPNVIMSEHSKTFSYTADHFAADQAAMNDGESRPPIFFRIQDEAHEYLRELTDPVSLNWTRLDFMWM